MSTHDTPWQEPRLLRSLQSFLEGWRFPVIGVTALGSFVLLLLAFLAIPRGETGLGAFAADFRQWCFGWDPATGRMEWTYVVMALLSPAVLGTILVLAWLEPLREARRAPLRQRVAAVLTGIGVLGVACSGLIAFARPADTGALPFPAEDLRTALPSPRVRLTDQDGNVVDLASLRGRVVLVTGIYARCSFTCPMIFAEAKSVLAALSHEERRDFVLVAITLDPQHDGTTELARLAAAHGLSAPQARLLGGPAADVEAALDAFSIARTRDAATGVIDHANLFILMDRDGRIAYRLSLGERQREWLPLAVRVLLAERPTVAS